jgi:hypothetical protein
MAITITTYDSEIRNRLPLGSWDNVRLILTNGATELTTGNGYTAGGKGLTNLRFDYTSGLITVRADAVSWRATGGSLSANRAYLQWLIPAPGSNANLVLIDFGATLTAPSNTALRVQWHADGLFTYSIL